MRTARGALVPVIRERDLVLLRSQTQRAIVTKSPVLGNTSRPTHSYEILPDTVVLCTGKTVHGAGLAKEIARDDMSAHVLDATVLDETVALKQITAQAKRFVASNGIVVIPQSVAEQLLKGTSVVMAEKAAKEAAEAAAKAEADKERAAARDAELAAQNKAHEDFLKHADAPVEDLSDAIVLHDSENSVAGPVQQEASPVEDKPVEQVQREVVSEVPAENVAAAAVPPVITPDKPAEPVVEKSKKKNRPSKRE